MRKRPALQYVSIAIVKDDWFIKTVIEKVTRSILKRPIKQIDFNLPVELIENLRQEFRFLNEDNDLIYSKDGYVVLGKYSLDEVMKIMLKWVKDKGFKFDKSSSISYSGSAIKSVDITTIPTFDKRGE